MSHLLRLLQVHGPRSLAICSLLDKPSRRQTKIDVDFLGFTIEDHFVVGYGLDYNNRFREIDEIVIFDPSQG
jgi:hypoxanthine phosphoribosyltransferase